MIPLHDINPRRRKPVVTVCLIAANVLLFFYEISLGPRLEGFLMGAAFIPARLFETGGAPGALVFETGSALLSMFLHGGWGHLLGNMLFLWVFGDNVESRLGHGRFFVFYLACGIAAAFAHAVANPYSVLPAIGASGAVSGVLGAYLFLYPTAPIVTLVILGFFIRLVQIPALVYLPFWFLIQFLAGMASLAAASPTQGGVAWFAHIGGFIAGPLLLFLLGGSRRH